MKARKLNIVNKGGRRFVEVLTVMDNPQHGDLVDLGDGNIVPVSGHDYLQVGGRKTNRVHRLVAERVLGRRLKARNHVHHVDGDRFNNRPSNLVICEDNAYHGLLERRARALRVTGNPNAVVCRICGDAEATKHLYRAAIGNIVRRRGICEDCHSRKYWRDQPHRQTDRPGGLS